MSRTWLRNLCGIAMAAGLAAGAWAESPSRQALREQARQAFGSLPAEAVSPENPITEEKVTLGRMLYYDTRLSKSQSFSCNSCHQLDRFGVDNEPTSPGHGGVRGDRNSPTVYNAALHVGQFWDGRAADVEEQAKGPILNSVEMGMPSADEVVVVLKSIPGYAPLFASAFPGDEDPITYDNLARAIGAFERRLLTPGPIDRFLAGELDALSEEQLSGLELFLGAGCTICHNGSAIGGGMYQKLGLMRPFPTEDPGRYRVTNDEEDRSVFKVPSLRNIAKTAPYFHDGSVEALLAAVTIMAHHQLGKDFSDVEMAQLIAFLESLTGTVDAAYVAQPELPASSDATPGPDPS